MEEDKKQTLKKYIIGFVLICSVIGGGFKIYNSEKQRQIAEQALEREKLQVQLAQAQIEKEKKEKEILEIKQKQENERIENEKLEKDGPPDLIKKILLTNKYITSLKIDYIKKIIPISNYDESNDNFHKYSWDYPNYSINALSSDRENMLDSMSITVRKNYLEIPDLINENNLILLGKNTFKEISKIQKKNPAMNKINSCALIKELGGINYIEEYLDQTYQTKRTFSIFIPESEYKFNSVCESHYKTVDYCKKNGREFYEKLAKTYGDKIPTEVNMSWYSGGNPYENIDTCEEDTRW